MKELIYISIYPSLVVGRERNGNLAAALQSEFLVQALNDIGYNIHLVSPNSSIKNENTFRINSGYLCKRNENFSIEYLPVVESKIRLLRGFGRIGTWYYLKRRIDEIDEKTPIIIYHSRFLYPLYQYLDKKHKKYIIEVEEIYSDVTQNKNDRAKELSMIGNAQGYIIPNKLMHPEITRDKPWVLYHGSCKDEQRRKKIFNDKKIHIVYAGTLDPRKIGELTLVSAAKYLDDNYIIHILGVGYPENLARIKNIAKNLKEPHCQVIFHEVLYGEEYLEFIQSCDIGIYPQAKEGIDINTSFPSKIMSYLSNGLRVVATKTYSLEKSEVADILFFSDSDDPKDIAKTIQKIDFSIHYDSRQKLKEIRNRLENELTKLISEIW